MGSRGNMGLFLWARLATRAAEGDVPAGATFRDAKDLGNIILDLYRAGASLWQLALLNAAMAPARSLRDRRP